MKTWYLLIIAVLLNNGLMAQEKASFQWPNHKATRLFKAFIKTYNSNNENELAAFAKEHCSGIDPKEWASYWPGVFADFGSVEVYKKVEEWTNEHRLALWFQGKDTKGWVAIILSMDAGGKIIGKSVARGLRPSGTLPPYSALTAPEIALQMDAYLEKLSQLDYFSGTVLIAKGENIVFESAYGMRNYSTQKRNNLQTSFCVASTTKTFTAMAILQLVEKGVLHTSDPISKYIQEYPKDIADQVTIHHLLNHTSGIELDDYKPYNKAEKKAKNLDDLLAAHIQYLDSMNNSRRNNFKVLGKHDYSNENYSLLGVIIERVSGITYSQYLEQYIFKPLGLTHTFSDYKKLKNHSNKAIGYTNKDKQGHLLKTRLKNTDSLWQFALPSGGVYASAKDLYTYFKAINGHLLLRKETRQWLYEKKEPVFNFSDYSRSYSYGFALEQKGKAFTIGHGGSFIGVGSAFEYYPEQDYYVIVLSNYGSMPAQTVSNYIKDLIAPND